MEDLEFVGLVRLGGFYRVGRAHAPRTHGTMDVLGGLRGLEVREPMVLTLYRVLLTLVIRNHEP